MYQCPIVMSHGRACYLVKLVGWTITLWSASVRRSGLEVTALGTLTRSLVKGQHIAEGDQLHYQIDIFSSFPRILRAGLVFSPRSFMFSDLGEIYLVFFCPLRNWLAESNLLDFLRMFFCHRGA